MDLLTLSAIGLFLYLIVDRICGYKEKTVNKVKVEFRQYNDSSDSYENVFKETISFGDLKKYINSLDIPDDTPVIMDRDNRTGPIDNPGDILEYEYKMLRSY